MFLLLNVAVRHSQFDLHVLTGGSNDRCGCLDYADRVRCGYHEETHRVCHWRTSRCCHRSRVRLRPDFRPQFLLAQPERDWWIVHGVQRLYDHPTNSVCWTSHHQRERSKEIVRRKITDSASEGSFLMSFSFDCQLPPCRSRVADFPFLGIYHPRTMEHRASICVDHRPGRVQYGCGRIQG